MSRPKFSSKIPGKAWLVPGILACVVTSLWVFPRAWYTQRSSDAFHWFAERRDIPGWTFNDEPIDKSAERILVADQTINGEYLNDNGDRVRVFAANRFEEKSNEIGLFIHTPDRCWVETGWKLEPAAPDVIQLTVHGLPISLERRIFNIQGSRELVYFCGLVGGEPLPYRLDHNLSAGIRSELKDSEVAGKPVIGASNLHFWQRLMTSFQSRRELFGPKQFIRISTPVRPGETEQAADQRLTGFLGNWLAPADYAAEKAEWQVKKVASSE